MKMCSSCKNDLPLTAFAKNASRPDGLQRSCRDCHSEYTRAHYSENKTYYSSKARKREVDLQRILDEAKDKPCKDCQRTYPPYVMDFDHLEKKDFNLANWKNIGSKARILAEIKKCELVCSNCHRIRTYNRRARSIIG